MHPASSASKLAYFFDVEQPKVLLAKELMHLARKLPGVHCIVLSAAVAQCTPLLAAASCERKTSLSPLGLNFGLMALSRPAVRQVAWGLESAGVLFLQMKGILMLYKAHGLLRQ